MYDTSNPYNWKHYKTVEYPVGQWTITDASLSPNNKWLAYSSIRPIVCLSSTDPDDDSDPVMLDFASDAGSRQYARWRVGGFGVRFTFQSDSTLTHFREPLPFHCVSRHAEP